MMITGELRCSVVCSAEHSVWYCYRNKTHCIHICKKMNFQITPLPPLIAKKKGSKSEGQSYPSLALSYSDTAQSQIFAYRIHIHLSGVPCCTFPFMHVSLSLYSPRNTFFSATASRSAPAELETRQDIRPVELRANNAYYIHKRNTNNIELRSVETGK